jgi:hypothetical protein
MERRMMQGEVNMAGDVGLMVTPPLMDEFAVIHRDDF